MSSRAWIFIVIIGIAGIGSFGLVTKLALDSNKGLQSIARFKVALLKQFSPQGIQSVSVRKIRRESRVVLLMTAVPERIISSPTIHQDIAELFFRSFSTGVQTLDLQYVAPPRWGCKAQTAFLEKRISSTLVQARLALDKGEQKLAEWLKKEMGLELVGIDLAGERVRCGVGWREGTSRVQPGPEAGGQLARALTAIARLPRGVQIDVRFLDLARSIAPREPGTRKPEPAPAASHPSGNVAYAEGVEGSRPAGALDAPASPRQEPSQLLGEWSFDFLGREISSGGGAGARPPLDPAGAPR
ncbi:MAG: hypothetical protein JXA90_11805 [Planctomycetes bacterium]|nr:hypothetical protein [Planctomycetota bacterium]